jgi:hypothetical protein
MNANELADKLEQGHWEGGTREQAANMLRQQQVEINSLRIHGYKTQYELLRLEFLQQQTEIEYWKEKFNKAMDMQELKPAKYTDAWWKEVEEFNKQLKVRAK